MHSMRFWNAILVCVWTCCAAVEARASVIMNLGVIVTPNTPDGFQYAYVLTNDATSSENLFDLSLTGFSGDLLDVVSPLGWTVITAPGFIDWTSIDPEFDLQPERALGGFGFSSIFGPTVGDYLVLAVDPLSGLADNFVQGQTSVPGSTEAAAPEPSSTALVALLMIVIAARWIRRQARPGT